MTRVYIADAILVERSALRNMLLDLKMEIAGESGEWSITLAQAPLCNMDMLVAEWELLPLISPEKALTALRSACPKALTIILISYGTAHRQAALSIGADMFISKGEMPERVADQLRAAATINH